MASMVAVEPLVRFCTRCPIAPDGNPATVNALPGAPRVLAVTAPAGKAAPSVWKAQTIAKFDPWTTTGVSTMFSCPRVSGLSMWMVTFCARMGLVVPHRSTMPPMMVLTGLDGLVPVLVSRPLMGSTYQFGMNQLGCGRTDSVVCTRVLHELERGENEKSAKLP